MAQYPKYSVQRFIEEAGVKGLTDEFDGKLELWSSEGDVVTRIDCKGITAAEALDQIFTFLTMRLGAIEIEGVEDTILCGHRRSAFTARYTLFIS